MLKLSRESIKNEQAWLDAGINLPKFSIDSLSKNPVWVHFGEGNIFRAFLSPVMQKLIEDRLSDSGIAVVSTYEAQTIDLAYRPYDNLCLQVIMYPDGRLTKNVIGSVTESLKSFDSGDFNRLCEIFENKDLQFASFTITEKGYSNTSTMSVVATLLHKRFLAGKHPIALVCMDNFSHNGDKLKAAVTGIIDKWRTENIIGDDFVNYVNDTNYVTFPWTMIDKITPRPSSDVAEELKKSGFGSTDIYVTDIQTHIAPFVNAEAPEYLVIEDAFPNGRPKLEHAGIYFTDRKTVDLVERMKVCTCLNPLHTALGIFGCLLGYKRISDEMTNDSLVSLIKKIGYDEGMPVVSNPGIIDPVDFIREVIEDRFANPYIPDTPQRIIMDTSQKIPVRFGETLKLYVERGMDINSLTYIPVTLAGWCRYLMGIDDDGNEMPLDYDPMLDELKKHIDKITFGDESSVADNLRPLLSDPSIFGINLYETELGTKTEGYFKQMISSPGAVKSLLTLIS